MKQLSVILLVLLFSLPLMGQSLFSWKKTAEESNAKNLHLTRQLDSLKKVADSLTLQTQKDSAIIQKLRSQIPQQETLKYASDSTVSNPDSLLHLWYQSIHKQQLEALSAEEIESKQYSSSVPDEVMIARLKKMNSFITIPFNQTVKKYMIYYSETAPQVLSRILGLSMYYFPIFEEKFALYGLPSELKYMAVVESILKPTASSRAGAKGIWQFMYRTARAYGLEIDSFVDERKDPEKSSEAAAKYLRDAYDVFHDWSLVISSYNCGPGNVAKAIRYADGKTDFWSVYDFLPRETRGYVPAMIGVMYAMTYHKEYGIEPADVGMPAQTDTFHIRKRLHFKQISELADIPEEQIKNLNPQYIHDIIPGTESKTYILRLPYHLSANFMSVNSDSLYQHRKTELLNDKILKDYVQHNDRFTYKVKKGDTLNGIARKYSVTVSQLKSWNKLKSDQLRIGQTLYIVRKR